MTFASNRALAIFEQHGVKMQTFDCAVQDEIGRPPVPDSHKLYRLLEKQPVIDIEADNSLMLLSNMLGEEDALPPVRQENAFVNLGSAS